MGWVCKHILVLSFEYLKLTESRYNLWREKSSPNKIVDAKSAMWLHLDALLIRARISSRKLKCPIRLARHRHINVL